MSTKNQNLQQYLITKGVTSTTSTETIAALKKAYSQQYHRAYYQERKQQEKRFSLRLDKVEHRRLKHHAALHNNSKLGVFIKQSALAYLDQSYIPRSPEVIDELQKDVRQIGNNINQIVHYLHKQLKFEKPILNRQEAQEYDWQTLSSNYENLVIAVSHLNEQITSYFTSPPMKLTDALMQVIQDDPKTIGELQAFLSEAKETLNPSS